MKTGSLNDVIMESIYDYINSIRLDENDPVVLLGEAALHKTLEYEDTSYLWEFSLLDNDGNKWLKTTYNRKEGTYTEYNAGENDDNQYGVYGPENLTHKIKNEINAPINSREFYRGENRYKFRKNIDDIFPDPKKESIKTEEHYNTNKSNVLDVLDTKIDKINQLSTGMQSIDSIKKEKEALQGFRDHIKNREFPKSWLAKKIAWFRSLYEKFMLKNKYAKDPGVIGWIKHVLACIVKIIDMLLAKLQHAVN